MQTGNKLKRQAAVLVLLTDDGDGEKVLLTQRAEHLHQHPGEIAFPGGKWEEGDDTLLDTALRETHEEVGIHPDLVRVTGELKSVYTRKGVKVTPFVGRVDPGVVLTANPEELDEMFWLPVQFLKQDVRARTDSYRHKDKVYWAPAYDFDGYFIWGFTARVLVDLLKEEFDVVLQAPSGAC